MRQSYSFSTDRQLRIAEWNDDIAEFTGRPPLTVMGKQYHEVLPRLFVGDVDAVALSMTRSEEIVLEGYGFACLHGRIDADVRILPLPGDRGGIDRVRIDFSPHSTCLMAIKFQNLQRLIDIGKIASTLAHGVRNPLNAIKGAVVHLRQKYADEPTLIEFTKIMEDEIQRLDHFISSFLSATPARPGPSEEDINALLKKIEVFTSMQTHAYRIETTFEYGKAPLLQVDPFQFEQAILNIINNAIEAMPSGGRLTIRTGREQRSAADVAVVEIADTGPGIAEEGISGITAPLGQRGRGFGLFIAREIVQYYNGQLAIESKKDRGTTVRLYFPVHIPGGG
ncbi:MAG: ATP-binding protein [Nitrospirota bacterium]